tara:strand:+ start:1082 stop:1711 length:630 start_codon:yes stop_codon:yes gene_type:complete
MECDKCINVISRTLPKIKYYSQLDEVSYTLRNKFQKKRMMIQDRVKRLQSLTIKQNYTPYFKSQIEKELYGGKVLKPVKFEKCCKCGDDRLVIMMLYIKHQLITKIFDFFGTNEHLLTESEKDTVEVYLTKYGEKIICKEWKGKYYYYLKVFGVPKPLKYLIDKELYQKRKNLNLESAIYFHPKASNGFAQECWEEIDAFQKMYHDMKK